MVLMASTVMIILNLIVIVKQDQTIHLNYAKVNCFWHSFFVKIIKQWNALPCTNRILAFIEVNLESILKFCNFFLAIS